MYSFHPPGIAAVRDGAAATDAKHRVPWHNLLGSALFAQIIECFRGTQLPYEQMAMKYVYPPLLKQDSGDSGPLGWNYESIFVAVGCTPEEIGPAHAYGH